MTLTIHPSQAYFLLAGLYIGKFTNIFSDVVITGLVLYIVTPEIFTEDRMTRAKNYLSGWIKWPSQSVPMEQSEKVTEKVLQLENNTVIDFFQLLPEQQKVLLNQHAVLQNLHNLQNLQSYQVPVKLPKIEIVSSPPSQIPKLN